METNPPLDNDFHDTLSINGEIRGFLQEIAKWANFIALVGFVMIGLMATLMLFMGSMMGALMGSEVGGAMGVLGGTGIMIVWMIILAISIFPILYLYRFAQNTKAALKSNNQQALTLAFQNLKSHYKFYGMMLAILLGFYAVMLAFGLMMGVGRMF
jgi:hypothetical protein